MLSSFDKPAGTEGCSPSRRLNVVTWVNETKARELKTAAEVLKAAEAGELTIRQLSGVINMDIHRLEKWAAIITHWESPF